MAGSGWFQLLRAHRTVVWLARLVHDRGRSSAAGKPTGLLCFGTFRGVGIAVFVDGAVGGLISRQFIPDTDKGSRKILAKGPSAGFPIVNVYDGRCHDADSGAVSFRLVVEQVCVEAIAKARPILLESFVDVVIHGSERFTGKWRAAFRRIVAECLRWKSSTESSAQGTVTVLGDVGLFNTARFDHGWRQIVFDAVFELMCPCHRTLGKPSSRTE
jgi:hypothetical protein